MLIVNSMFSLKIFSFFGKYPNIIPDKFFNYEIVKRGPNDRLMVAAIVLCDKGRFLQETKYLRKKDLHEQLCDKLLSASIVWNIQLQGESGNIWVVEKTAGAGFSGFNHSFLQHDHNIIPNKL